MTKTGERIRELRLSLGYSPDAFAQLLGIGRSSLYRYENSEGIKGLPMSAAIILSEKFGVSLDWLAGTSDEKYRVKYSFDTVYDSLSEEGKKQVFDYAMYVKSKEERNGE